MLVQPQPCSVQSSHIHFFSGQPDQYTYAAMMSYESINSYMSINTKEKLQCTELYPNHTETKNEKGFWLLENCFPKSWKSGGQKQQQRSTHKH